MPIEPIEERYSEQWMRWFSECFVKENIPFKTFGSTEIVKIKDGEFLDSAYTMKYKLKQASDVCEYIDKNRDKDFTVFCLDTWNPCLLNIAYMRDTLGLKIKIKSMLHAGVYDSYDFLARTPVSKWGIPFEDALYRLHDEIFIATDYHKHLWEASHGNTNKFTKVSWPVSEPKERFKWCEKQNLVVFPHRLAPEKCPELFDKLEIAYNDKYPEDNLVFLKTKNVCKTKDEYYSLLDEAKFAVSFAQQETFGIAMQEAVNRGCIPIVPDRRAYSELFTHDFKFLKNEDAVERIRFFLKNPKFAPIEYTNDIRWIKKI